MPETRIPKSGKAVAKRERIIEKGFELMCERGYYKTSTPEIAKAADVSTGIIYQYFNDKREIFCLEANTLPGMTPTSLIPQEAAAQGISYNDLCEWIIEISMKRRAENA